MAQQHLHFSFNISSDQSGDNSKELLAFDVVEFKLTEGLNSPFRLEVELISHDPSVDFSKVLDQGATLTIWEGSKAVRHIHGAVSNFTQGKTGFRRTRYSAIIEPNLARTQLTSDWRIYQQSTAPEIIASVFKSDRLSNFEINTQNKHTLREYCVQAGQLNFDFVQRLAAEEGFIYAFKHEAGHHQLLMTDVIQTLGSIGDKDSQGGDDNDGKAAKGNNTSTPVLYNPNPAGDKQQSALHTLIYQENVRTATQTQREYTFKNPMYSQEHASRGKNLNTQGGAHQATHYERYDYPGQYKADEVGKPFTATRIQSLRNDAQVATVIGDDARIQPGFAFELIGHPRSDMNIYWRPVEVTHIGTQHTAGEEEAATADTSTRYEQTATLVPANSDWKAPIAVNATIRGPLIAHVAGPEGEEIYVDEFGRVKVQFPWDRQGSSNEHSSCWIRVAQNWAGAGWGHIAIPRIGQEVIVDFLDGDESQPIIIGRTYDANHPTPYKLPALKAQNTIKSKEHKGSGYNELLIDDTTQEIKTQLHTTHAATQLTMGFLTHPRAADGSGEHRGDGFELRTDTWGSIRAGKGLYVSADKQDKAQGKQLDIAEAIVQLEVALSLAKDLASASQTAGTAQTDTQTQEHQLNNVYKELQQSGILVSSPQGIATVTPSSAQISVGKNITLTALQNTDINTLKNYTVVAGDAVSILSVEKEMNLISNKGELKLQAQHNKMDINAQNDLSLTSSKGKVTVTAKDELLLTCGGAYIKLKGGQVEVGSSTPLQLRTGGLTSMGSNIIDETLPSFSRSLLAAYGVPTEHNIQFHFTNDNQVPYAHTKYTAYFEDGSTTQGVTNKDGYTKVFLSNQQEEVKVHLHLNDAKKMVGDYNLNFHFFDDDGVPYANTSYTAYRSDGAAEKGVTDEEGYTEIFYADEPEEITVHLDI